jgi:1-phosphofructokinase family hexose kinase
VIVFVAGSPSIDRTHEISALKPGTIHRPTSVVAVPGGKALNAARAAHHLGAQVRAIALLGGHAGRWIADALRREGLDYEVVDGPGESRMALSVSNGDALTEFYEPPPPIAAEHWDALEAAVTATAADWVALSGSLPPGAPPDAYARLAGAARRAGARVALDARGEGLFAALHTQPDFVKVNASEAAELGYATAPALRAAAGAAAAAITHGTDGIELATASGLLRAAPPTVGRFPVGSGDAALGGFLTALDAEGDWSAALQIATGAAAANAEQPGAGRLDGARALALAREVRVVS